MNLLQESYQRLFPEKEFPYQTYIEYNRRLSPFNANILKQQHIISVHLNLQWKDIDDEIKIGLIQHLLLKIFKEKKHTPNIELYHNFVKNIPLLTEKNKTNPLLEAAFQRTNERFFFNQLEKPNLIWGQQAFRKLASYNFHNDTITVSSLFCNAPAEILDYLIYHEMLHKHLKFRQHNGRSSFHSREFREAEKAYPLQRDLEKKITAHLRQTRGKNHFFSALKRYF